ncbi:MAG: recombinase family protein [Oscillospiraceae bacterium]|nr:recombinase family protein [Oscillospiraceae bacterium]
MAGNRKLPFGYKMELGKVVIHPVESAVVQQIYQEYILGASYTELVKVLREQNVTYDQGKIWNKNMIARILENRKYVGQSDWPSIITAKQYDQAARKRSSKASPPQKTAAQKILRRLSSGGSIKDIEQQVCNILNSLIVDPYQIGIQQRTLSAINRDIDLQPAWEHELEQQPVNEDNARQLAMEMAAAQYDAIGNQDYETERLRRLFQRQQPMKELDAELLQSAVSAVQIKDQKLLIRLKNGQIIERNR